MRPCLVTKLGKNLFSVIFCIVFTSELSVLSDLVLLGKNFYTALSLVFVSFSLCPR